MLYVSKIYRRKDWSYNESLVLLDIIASHWGILNNKKTNNEKAKVWQKMFDDFEQRYVEGLSKRVIILISE